MRAALAQLAEGAAAALGGGLFALAQRRRGGGLRAADAGVVLDGCVFVSAPFTDAPAHVKPREIPHCKRTHCQAEFKCRLIYILGQSTF